MAYNELVDAAMHDGQVGPDRPAVVRRDPVSTNHQDGAPARGPVGGAGGERVGEVGGVGSGSFSARYAKITATHEREGLLRDMIADPGQTPETLASRFLDPPLFSGAYDRGWGTLYIASYSPADRSVELRWRDGTRLRQSIGSFVPGAVAVRLG